MRLTVIRQGVQGRARASTITLLWGDILRPLAASTWLPFRCDMADLAIWKDEVRQRQNEVPSKDEEILKEPHNWGDKKHGQNRKAYSIAKILL